MSWLQTRQAFVVLAGNYRAATALVRGLYGIRMGNPVRMPYQWCCSRVAGVGL
ncbi:hypothetical protein IWX76_002215 [Pedobacter sp. CAN_A7]